MNCPKCKEGKYVELDRETNAYDKTYALLECEKCKYTVIVPAEKGKK